MTRQAVGNWEAGRSAPREEHLPALEAALGLPARTLSDILALNPPAPEVGRLITTAEAAERDPDLHEVEREVMIAVYQALTNRRGRTPPRR